MNPGLAIIGTVQIGEDFGGQYYLPYSVGVLLAYAKAHLPEYDRFRILPPVYKREPIGSLVDRLSPSEIVVFSAYVWNQRFSLELALRVKETNPECTILFGGPQVPENRRLLEQFLVRHPFIDLACYGEGEAPFLEVLRRLSRKHWEGIESIAWRSGNSVVIGPPATRIRDLDLIPSPYLDGIFDSLIASKPEERWQALLETNRGCPFRCSFCTWGNENKRKVYSYSLNRIFEEIDWISRHRIEFVFCCDANFGLFPERDMEIVKKVADNKSHFDYPKAFSVQSTKNATTSIFQLNKVLNDAGLQKGVNLALQSVNERTLKSIRRSNISNKTYDDLQKLLTSAGISTFSDIILGLPQETYDTFVDGVAATIAQGQHNRIQFINLSILENSEMALPEYQRRYGMVVRECRLVSHHTSLDNAPGIEEKQLLSVGTSAMPSEEWVRAKVFCWLTSLLHFDKVFQIPMLVLTGPGKIGFRELMEAFLEPDPHHPVLCTLEQSLEAKARAILGGEGDFLPSREWLNIWWPADEYMFIKLSRENLLPAFYREAEEIASASLVRCEKSLPDGLLKDAIRLNASLLKHPGPPMGGILRLRYNLWDWYLSRLRGEDCPLERGEFVYDINPEGEAWSGWEEWMREVVWFGGKRGAYLYSCHPSQSSPCRERS